ncbi:MAG: energy-coupling factor ABC transporter ATP-binding protein, partial [Treponema sp.]|nr:energy-coupling factor ABC transporter ATP-binding protein [Treponema sp.]
GAALFSVRKLIKIFPGGPGGNEALRVLDEISLDIYEGPCLVIAGSNGSGKTVLMKILAALMEADGGEVLYRGLPLGTAPWAARGGGPLGGPRLPRTLGLVFQDADAQLIGETVAEDAAFGPRNLGFSREESTERALAALTALGLAGRENQSPRRLSGGEKRRLAVAGVIAMGCRTIIMDEPFANLDWPGVRQTLELIKSLKASGNTLIILTHELEKVLAYADRLVILHRGKLREDGPPGEVLGRLREEYGVRNPLQSYTRVADCTWLGEGPRRAEPGKPWV